jgi:hypothetical protein
MNQQQIDSLARLLVDRAGGDVAFERQIHDAPRATLGALGIPAEAVPPVLDQVQALEAVRARQLEGRTAIAPPPRTSPAWAAARKAPDSAPAPRPVAGLGSLAAEGGEWPEITTSARALENYAG